jgi:hypothetical protein
MLEALMRRPESFGAAQVERMREAGHDRFAIEDAVAVGTMFACITRVADALGFAYPNTPTQGMTARYLLGAGYAPAPARLAGARRYAEAWAKLEGTVQTTPGHTEPALRRRVSAWIERDARGRDAELGDLPDELRPLLAKASRNAYQITDEDIATLLGRGWHEGAVFEMVVVIAVAAGASRYAIAMDALDALGLTSRS